MFGIMTRLFAWAITFGLGQFLINLGIGLFVFVGLDFVIEGALSLIQSNIDGLPADLLSILELMGFSTGLTMLASAMVTGVGIKVAMKKTTMGKITA